MTRARKSAPGVARASDSLGLPGHESYDRRSRHRAARPEPELFDPVTVSLDPGVALVEASAGTGKTYCITLTVVRLLLEPDDAGRFRTIGRILVVTFTNAATDELITRLRRTLREAVGVFDGSLAFDSRLKPLFELRDRYGDDALPRLRDALASLDQLSVFTIHGFCKRVLEESALESNTPFGATFLEDDALLVERVAQDWWRRTIYEDEALAAVAVHRGWTWDQFLVELKSFRRWPDTRLEPDVPLGDAARLLRGALDDFARAWDAAEARVWLDAQGWLKEAALADPELRKAIVRAGTLLASGDLAGGLTIVRHCTTSALLGGMRKASRAEKAAREAVPDLAFARACDAIEAALALQTQALRVSCLREVDRDFHREKERRHLLGFDDLLRRLCDAVTREGADGHLARSIRARYDAALIDEFQDTDPFQFPIFATAFTGRPLFLIGDPKQAIYGFRGADIFAYMRAAERAERHYTLRDNWRSTQRFVDGVNALFTDRPDPFLYSAIPYASVKAARPLDDPLAADGKGALHWWFLPPRGGRPLTKTDAESRIRMAVCREIVSLISPADGEPARLVPGDIAVLVRATWEGEALKAELDALGVPAILAGMGNILTSPELEELERVLRAVERPHHAPTVRAALATEMLGADAATIRSLAQPDGEEAWERLVGELVDAREQWTRFGFMRMMQELMERHGIPARLLSFTDGERRLTNLRHAVELLHSVALEERMSAEALLLWIARSRARAAVNGTERDSELTQLRLESDADAVQIVTIHKSKGLEYEVVFCPSLVLPRMPEPDEPIVVHEPASDGGKIVVFDHGSEHRDARARLANAERLAEDLRLAYVALTRARFRTYVAWGALENRKSGAGAWDSALGYLLRADSAEGTEADVADAVSAGERDRIDAWEARLREIAAAAPAGAMSVEVIDGDVAVTRWRHRGSGATAPACRETVPGPSQLDTWRIASFTSLTRDRHVEDARDLFDGDRLDRDDALRALPRSDFMTFPAGRIAGIVLHEVFERVDFGGPASDTDATVRETLLKSRLVAGEDDPRIAATIVMVHRTLCTMLPGAGFRLRDIPKRATLREWKFHLPLGVVEQGTLADLFARHGDDVARRYAPALRSVSRDRTHGFLSGVVDLAFEHDGRWHVADWKSNHLGIDPAGYEPAALESEMIASHYVLQYHLYVVALHRFLRQRVPGYRYATHMGDAWYAFLRGIDGTGRGWFRHRPAEALIDALDALMSGRVPAPTADRPPATR